MKRCCAKICYNSQTNNKNVYYFGFPKNEFYAHKWATSANRQDLLEKPLHNIIKYYLCSAHFTNDCFQDTPKNSILKKTMRPITVPIPTIFVSNINQYIPKTSQINNESKKKIKTKEKEEIHPKKKLKIEKETENIKLEHSEYVISLDNNNVIDDDPLTDCNNIIFYEKNNDNLQQENSCYYENTIETVEISENPEIIIEYLCRLCACTFSEDKIISIFNTEVEKYIEKFMPNMIFKDDGLPQNVCNFCYDKIIDSMKILQSFHAVQNKFKNL